MTTLQVINFANNKRYNVEAKHVKDFHKTSLDNSVAWNGSLNLYVDNKGQYYLEHHSGNSNHESHAVMVNKNVENMSCEEAMEYVF